MSNGALLRGRPVLLLAVGYLQSGFVFALPTMNVVAGARSPA